MSKDLIQKFMDNNPSPVVQVALDGTLLSLNSAAREFLESQGWSEKEYTNILPPNFHEINLNCKAAEIGLPVTTMEFSITSILWTPFFNEDMDRVVYTGVDITRMRRNEIALIRAKEQAEEGERLKAAFLDNMSHEIRTPLNSLLGFMNLLNIELIDILNEDQKFYFDLIQTNGLRLERTMREILDISNFSSGTYEPTFIDLDLASLIRGIIQNHTPKITEKELDANIDIPDTPMMIHSDLYCLTQMITHLLENAIIYTAAGSIGISLVSTDDWLEIRIDDTGIGMDEDQQRQIFVPFSQGSIGHTKQHQGIGLGLALVRSYCDTISARIDLVSEKDRGSHYTISIPRSHFPA